MNILSKENQTDNMDQSSHKLYLQNYYDNALEWYNSIYISPLQERSMMFIVSITMVLNLVMTATLLNSLFPLRITVNYIQKTDDLFNKTANVVRANAFNNPKKSIAKVLSEYYIIRRESYDFNLLERQKQYIKNNSSVVINQNFENSLDLSNNDSPILKYEQDVKVNTKIKETIFNDDSNEITIYFIAQGFKRGQKIFHNHYKVTLNYEMDNINHNALHGTQFHFQITSYAKEVLSEENLSN